jgi:hypothetical protein
LRRLETPNPKERFRAVKEGMVSKRLSWECRHYQISSRPSIIVQRKSVFNPVRDAQAIIPTEEISEIRRTANFFHTAPNWWNLDIFLERRDDLFLGILGKVFNQL